jgi:RES domain
LTPPALPGPEPGQRRARWQHATRIIASRYPPIQLFERVSPDPGVWDALVAAEMLVNPRIRDEVGEVHLVFPRERVSGPGATYVMAAFTHLNPKGSRFSDGTYGVYYAGREFETALRETAYHFGRIAADSGDGTRYEDMRVLVSRIDARFHDLETLPRAAREVLLDPDSYASSQPFGARLREIGSNGLVYPSVRNGGGRCVASFRPKAVGFPVQTKHLKYHYDGQRVVRYFDYEGSAWHLLEP